MDFVDDVRHLYFKCKAGMDLEHTQKRQPGVRKDNSGYQVLMSANIKSIIIKKCKCFT